MVTKDLMIIPSGLWAIHKIGSQMISRIHREVILALGAAVARTAVSAPDPVLATAMTFSLIPIQPRWQAIIIISMQTLVPCQKTRRRLAMACGTFIPYKSVV